MRGPVQQCVASGWWSRWRAGRRGAARVGAYVLGLSLLGCGGGGSAPLTAESYLLAPEQTHYGASYAVWSQRWWQWCYELPFTNHPLFDHVGTQAWRGQVDPVWFIGGELCSLYEPCDGSAERSITIPAGTALFFPIVNVSWTNQECVDPDTTYSYTELRQFAADAVEAATDILCEVDGVTIVSAPTLAGAVRFRAQAEEFGYTIPADNVFVAACADAPVSVVHAPVAADGIYVMLAPLAPGTHTIHCAGAFPTLSFTMNVVYHVTVTE